MAKTISKAARIRELYAEHKDDPQVIGKIAYWVECSPEYVRVVARQRVYKGLSASDIRYRSKPEMQETIRAQKAAQQRRYYASPAFRQKKAEYSARKYRERRLASASESS